MPKVQDLGDQVSAIPALTYEFLRPNWSRPDRPVARRNAAVAGPRHGLPDGRPGDAPGGRATRSTRTRSTPGSWAAPSRSPTRTSPPSAWFFADQPPATFDPEKAKSILDAAGWVAGRRRHPREERPQGQDRALHDDPPGPPGHARAVADCLKDVGIEARRRTRSTPTNIFADYNEATARHPVRPLARATSTSPSTPSRARSTRSATTSTTTRASSSRMARTTPRSRTPTSTRPSTPSRTASTSQVIKDAMAEFQKIYVEKTVEVPLYYRKNVDLVSPKLGNFFANPTQAGPDLERGRLVRQASSARSDPPGSTRAPRLGAPARAGAPSTTGVRDACAPMQLRTSGTRAGPRSSDTAIVMRTGGEPMTKYVIRRVVQAIPVLFGITHRRLRHPPGRAGRPDRQVRQQPADDARADKRAFKKAWGLDQPIPIQYCRWLGACNPDGDGLGSSAPAPSSARRAGRTSCRTPSAAPRTASSTATSATRSTPASRSATGSPGPRCPTFILASVALVIWIAHRDRDRGRTRRSDATRCSTRSRRSSPTSASRCPRSGSGSC